MKLASWNVNGIRACLKNGLLDFLKQEQPDYLFIQESKANLTQVNQEELNILGYNLQIHHAIKPGYSGVGVISKNIAECKIGIDNQYFDNEGRIIKTKINEIELYNIYFPSGSSGEIRQKYKYEFLDFLYDNLKKINLENLIICGDVNICHQEIDIHHPKQATKLELSGFLQPERDWVSKFLNLGFIDIFRYLYPENQTFSWWTYRQNARAKNLGWRIDYFFISKNLLNKVKDSKILNNYLGSDHCPIILEIDL